MQFYNNYCNVPGGSFNYQTWADWAAQSSPNTRVVVGVVGSPRGGSGYADPGTIANVVGNVRSDSHFGGTAPRPLPYADGRNLS
jgi:chitinase